VVGDHLGHGHRQSALIVLQHQALVRNWVTVTVLSPVRHPKSCFDYSFAPHVPVFGSTLVRPLMPRQHRWPGCPSATGPLRVSPHQTPDDTTPAGAGSPSCQPILLSVLFNCYVLLLLTNVNIHITVIATNLLHLQVLSATR
jgi:hypothetical protein